jgi:lipoprotein-anchoring transpeptidase ErfK/SrfK
MVRKMKVILLTFLLAFQFTPLISAEIMEEREGVYLEINKATNTLQVYLNNHVIYTFRVATGKEKESTPLGTFKVVTKVKEPWYLPKDIAGGSPNNPLGTRWIGLNVPNTNGYEYGIHGTKDPSSIGRYVSQGCIRMHNKDVEWLFRHIPKGTLVIIKNEPKQKAR